MIVPTRVLTETGMGAKERDWNRRELLCELRQQGQNYSNFHLKLYGHDIHIEHHCNKDHGIEIEHQPKMGGGAGELLSEGFRRSIYLQIDRNLLSHYPFPLSKYCLTFSSTSGSFFKKSFAISLNFFPCFLKVIMVSKSMSFP